MMSHLIFMTKNNRNWYSSNFKQGPGAIRADFGPMPEINFVVITI